MKFYLAVLLTLVACSVIVVKVACIKCFECYSYKSVEECEADLWAISPCPSSYDACVKFKVELTPMVKMDKMTLSGYGRTCGHKSQCTITPKTCINYWGKDRDRRLIMNIKAEDCKVECCEKDFCHTPVEKRPKSPLRLGNNRTRVYNDGNGPNVGARGSGGTFEPHLCFLLIGVALFKSILHLCVH